MASDPQAFDDRSLSAPPPDELSDAVLRVLAGEKADDIEAEARAGLTNRMNAVKADYEVTRARYTFQLKALDDQIARFHEAVESLKNDRTERIDRERRLNLDAGRLRAVEAEIRAKRFEKERERLREELDRLTSLEELESKLLGADRRAEYEQELRFWQETEEERNRRIKYLESEKERIERDIAAAEKKVEAIRDRHVTRTLSGFLLWVGYGSAAATGTVTAVLLASQKDPAAPLADALNGLRGFVLSVSPTISGPVSLLLIGGLLLAAMAALGGVIFLTDWVITRFDRKWRGTSGRDQASRTTPLRPPDITRSSYVQLLATFPYVFAIGLVAAVFAVGDRRPNDLFGKLFPSLVNTFIGTVVALVAAAVFVMYAIKIIEVRQRKEDSTWLNAWEFFILPLLLLLALATSIMSTSPGRPVWGTWAAFMLLSSVTLAYGVVYHGLFKDHDKLRWMARRFEDEIRALSSPPLMGRPTRQEVAQAKAMAREFGRERERLRLLDQHFSIKRILTSDDQDDFVLLDRWLSSYGRMPRWGRATPARTYDAYRVLDIHAAPEQVIVREELRAAIAEHQTAIRFLDEGIEAKRLHTQPEQLDALTQERASIAGSLDASRFEEQRASAQLQAEFGSELQHLRGAMAVGGTVKPSFDRARTGGPPPPPAAPVPPFSPKEVRP
jgi:hypothetical protein